MRVALHACCGPCALEPLEVLAAEHEVVLVFANPNIQPAEEYVRRRDTLLEWAARSGVEVVEVEGGPGEWERATERMRDNPRERCHSCYEVRLSLAAAQAPQLGCEALATTLSVSPYQDAVAIDEVGREVAAAEGLVWVGSDYRDRYPEATRRSRELGMFRQNYCGCLPSRVEAEAGRADRRAGRTKGASGG